MGIALDLRVCRHVRLDLSIELIDGAGWLEAERTGEDDKVVLKLDWGEWICDFD